MTGLASVIAASAAFVGSHFLLSHPLRAILVRRLGEASFLLLYSLVAFATLGWMVAAMRAMPAEAPLWQAGEALWTLAALLMLAGSILFAGSLVRNPALPGPAQPIGEPRGVFTLTRHPMMWGFALWGVVHILVWPTPSNIVVGVSIILLALGGAAGQDVKKLKLQGERWRSWMMRTAFVPFARGGGWPGWTAIGGGTLLWLVATWAHAPLGAPAAGPWRWLA